MKNEELKTKEERLGYWMWGADEPAHYACNLGHANCGVEADGICMDWLQIQVDREFPVREKTEGISLEDIFKNEEGGSV
jgi:hypothetical protein